MHPTVDEQLRGVRRLLDAVASDERLSPGSAEALHDARLIVRRLESSWSAVLPFLDWDNRATETLLADLARLLPGVPPPVARTGPELEFEVAHRRNVDLRARLAEAVRVLDSAGLDPDSAVRARALVVSHLRERLRRDPANRRPAPAPANPEGERR
jgi:hypothetical protein